MSDPRPLNGVDSKTHATNKKVNENKDKRNLRAEPPVRIVKNPDVYSIVDGLYSSGANFASTERSERLDPCGYYEGLNTIAVEPIFVK